MKKKNVVINLSIAAFVIALTILAVLFEKGTRLETGRDTDEWVWDVDKTRCVQQSAIDAVDDWGIWEDFHEPGIYVVWAEINGSSFWAYKSTDKGECVQFIESLTTQEDNKAVNNNGESN